MEKNNNSSDVFTDYFRSHPRDIWLTLIVLVLSVLLYSIPRYRCIDHIVDISAILPAIELDIDHEGQTASGAATSHKTPYSKHSDEIAKSPPEEDDHGNVNSGTEIRPIDPNNASYETLTAMGVESRIASNWVKYIEAGGHFWSEDDLLRIYGMTADMVEGLEGRIAWKAKPEKTYQPEDRSSYEGSFLLDINLAMATDWQRIYGIGPVLSERIVNFRESLGGFHSIDQVSETYGISDSLFRTFKDHLFLNTVPDSLYINRMSEKELSGHPYVSYKQARVLSLYKKEHGPYLDIEDLVATHVVDSSWLEKLKPYLSFEN